VGGALSDRPPTVDVRELYYSYPPLIAGEPPAEALQGVSFSLGRGEFLAVMGPSGAGKTTLCLALCGIVPHSTGGIFGGMAVVCGQDTRRTTPAQLSARVGVVFQDPESQLFTTTVEDEVAFGLESQGLPRGEVAERVTWALGQVRLSEHRERNPAYLSGGQKQRVAIAAAIATRPELLVLDEPTASLDPVGSQEVVRVLTDLRQELDSSVVMVTHDAELAAEFADRVLLMHEGGVDLDASTPDVLADPGLLVAHGVRAPAMAELAAYLRRHGLPLRFHTLAQAKLALSIELAGGMRATDRDS